VGTQKICQEQRRQKQNNDGTLPAWTPGLLDAVWEQPSVLTAPLLLNFEFFFSQLTTRMYHRTPMNAILVVWNFGPGFRPGPYRTRPEKGIGIFRI